MERSHKGIAATKEEIAARKRQRTLLKHGIVPSRFEYVSQRPQDLVLKPACVWLDIFRKLAEYRAYKSLVV